MARTELTVNQITIDGVVQALIAAAADGNSFRNSGRQFILVKNGDSAPHTVTFQTPGEVGGLALEDPATVIAAGASVLFGPFRPLLFNQTAGVDIGKVYVDYSGVTSVTVEVFQL